MKERRYMHAVVLTMACVFIFPLHVHGQGKVYKNSVGVSYTSLHFGQNEEYIGAGVEYRFMPKPWIGVQVQFSRFPGRQITEYDTTGGQLDQEDASLLAGHRWGKVGIYGEGGGGVLRANVFTGASAYTFQQFYDVRHYPDVIMGGLVDVSVARRWSLTFNVRNNLTFLGPYTAIGIIGLTGPIQAQTGTINAPEGRAGVAFHF